MMDDAINEAKTYGVHIYKGIDKTEFINAVQPIHAGFLAKGAQYKALYDDIQKYAKGGSSK